MHWSRRSLLASAAAAALAPTLPSRARAGATGAGPNLVFVHPHGGWDTSYSIDPKPDNPNVDAPPGAVRSFGEIDVLTADSRPSVTRWFEKYGERAVVIHGIAIGSIAHLQCTQTILSGGTDEHAPDVVAIAAHLLGRDRPLPYLMISDRTMVGPLAAIAGRVGPNAQIKSLLDHALALPPVGSSGHVPFVPDPEDEDLIAAYVEANAARAQEGRALRGYNADRMADFLEGRSRGVDLAPFAEWFSQAGDLMSLDGAVALGLDALESGMSKTVMIESFMDFDTHRTNSDQDSRQEALYAGLDALFDGLAARPGEQGGSLLDETLVVVASELSRTPKLNGEGGKDHWPFVSAVIAGGGINGGRVLGRTDDEVVGEFVDLATGAVDPNGAQLRASNVLAGVLAAAGCDPEPWFPGVVPLGGILG